MLMKAAIFEKPGLDNLKINHDVDLPKITDHDVLIRVKMAGVNPIDHRIHISLTGSLNHLMPLPQFLHRV